MKYTEKVRCFDSIRVKPLEYLGKSIRGTVSFLSGSTEESFELIFTYSDHVDADENLAGMLLTMAAINFTYFSGSLVLEFPVLRNCTTAERSAGFPGLSHQVLQTGTL